ncbi:TonB-dependent receptor [Sphingomonas sabuli]|uniref:TonB-dependent receptor n=2 Tax=Sphingomonas sabuli TaxID=2764186 RepID=A0A7G9L636_9SPHN|nr:TonB-dependent receptor [Sphingomonas sabuli]
MKLEFRQRLLATTLLVGASMVATPAFAQDASEDPAAAPPSGPIEAQPIPERSATGEAVDAPRDIVVTGSRIPQPNLDSASPVAVVSEQEVKLTGTTRIEDVIAQLPGATASQSSGLSNGATGTAEIDLRFLGSKRTLSLVNGRRMTPGDPNSASQAADVNLIPASILKRVEVLTGGASSVYGADAVAGVVNFIIDTDFDGIKLDGQYSFYQHNNDCPAIEGDRTVCDALNAFAGDPQYAYPTSSVTDGRAVDFTVSIGSGFDDGRGHAMGYFGYRKVKPVLQANRDYSACALTGAGATVTCGGSGTAGEGNALVFVPTTDAAGNVTYTSTYAALGPGTATLGPPNLYNYAPLNYFQRPDERYVAGAFADYEISPAIKPYLEFMFMDDRTLAQIAPSGDFFSTLTINCDNPLLSAQQRSVICDPQYNLINGFIGSFPTAGGASYNPTPDAAPIEFIDSVNGGTYNRAYFQLGRRNVEGGPRISDLKHTSYRGVFGTRGDLSPVFSYDAYYQYGATNYTQVYRNEFSIARLTRALDVVEGPDGAPACRSALDGTDPLCVPYDVFGGTPSAASINYLNIFGVIDGRTSEQVFNANVTGAMGEMGWISPWASDGVGINVGFEYRKEKLTLNPDQSFQTGDLAGQGAPTLPVNGSFNVKEVFGEIQIPIVQQTIFEELTFGAGYRKSWYETSGDRKYDTDTYKLSLEFAPIRDVRFRAAYNRAARAPNIQELFAPQFVGLDGSDDPCAGAPIEATDYGCIAQGLAVGQSTPANPAEQYNGLLGGNPNLNPEKATTKTVGVVLQPRFIPRFALTVDYFNIDLKDAIQGFGADSIVQDCVGNATASFTPASCALINRDPAGSIWLTPGGFVTDLNYNVGGIETSGIDVTAAYSTRLFSLGNLSATFSGTYLDEYITDNGLTTPYDCAGYYGGVCSGGAVSSTSPLPEWRHKARATLQTPMGLGVSVQWRHIGSVEHERLGEDISAGAPPVLSQKIHAENYIDLAATYSLFNDRLNLRAGVNNVFDNVPPRITGSSGSCPAGPCNGNTYPGLWDALGRYVYAGFTLAFTPPPPAPPVYVAPPPPPPAAPATQTCPDGTVILATEVCPAPPPPPPPPPPAPERG